MRVLFVPHNRTVVPHGIPLLALKQKCVDPAIEMAFLLPRAYHALGRVLNINVLNIDHSGFRTEMEAYGQFRPDVVVDDCSPSTGSAAKFAGLPRVTILRTGTFPGYVPRNPSHRHSMGNIRNTRLDATYLGLSHPQGLSDLFVAEQYIIPGIPSIELFPASLADNTDYFFSGPLLIDDLLVEKLERVVCLSRNEVISHAAIDRFLWKNRDRKIIYITFGNVAKPRLEMNECIRACLDRGIAVLSNVTMAGLSAAQQELFYYSMYFPMHHLCAAVNLMIHHCGSGTYHYPLLHGVPTITVGTRCFDRDDVAMRLEELGVSTYMQDPDDEPAFVSNMMNCIDFQIELSGYALERQNKRIAALQQEIQSVSDAFCFDQVVQQAVAIGKGYRLPEREMAFSALP